MRMYDIIEKKRDGNELCKEELSFFIKGYTSGDIPDYQASALLMAIFLRGMTDRETALLTKEMADSGDKIDLSRFGNLSVDKHSTGGVGDKTTLIVAPTLAALGSKVAKMSGRGLGHTGGTVDKLESIKGYNTTLSPERFLKQVEEISISVIGQSGNLTPADKKLYALRDVTATVDSIPLITSSIMSKKIAAGSKNIVLDVKVGSGAFMKKHKDAVKLATSMVNIGKICGRRVSAVLTDMDCPLGSAVGNSLEVIEAAEVLKGNIKGDLYEVSCILAAEMLSLSQNIKPDSALEKVRKTIDSGAAFEKMKEWATAQGADPAWLDDTSHFEKSRFSLELLSRRSGYISSMDAGQIGTAAVILGAGRENKGDRIDFSAGIKVDLKVSDKVKKGQRLCTLYSSNEQKLSEAAQRYLSSLTFSEEKSSRKPLVYEIIR